MSVLKPNNQKSKRNNEQGAVMFVSVFAVTIFILLAAMIMDFGLFYYKQARLQNAGDAAATAVAASIDATDKDLNAIAKQYLKKNGVDYSDDDMTINIQKKGMLDEATANDDDYITTGYIKMTVKIKTGTLFGPILDIDSLMLHSTSFVKVSANYSNGMPRALNYTLFAGSTEGTAENPAIKINGRTGTAANIIVSGFETMLNKLNEKLFQPLKGFFGGTPNYTDLVHINLSEAITNGDIHSNSNMNLFLQEMKTVISFIKKTRTVILFTGLKLMLTAILFLKEIKTVISFIQTHLQLMITATRYIRLTKTETISLKKMPTAMCLRMKMDILFMSRNMSLST